MDPNTEKIEKTTFRVKTLYDKEYWKKHFSWTFNNI